MDWQKEKDSLTKGSEKNWWKPEPGQHKILFLSDGEEYEYEWDDKKIKKVRFDIEINKEKFDWGVTKGTTENSLFGQIALIAATKGRLDGEMITLIVKGQKKETSYTVLEALDLMTKEEKVDG